MIAGHLGNTQRVLRGWYESVLAGGQFADWEIEFLPGSEHPGSGSGVRFLRGDATAGVAAELLAWPSGCIDTTAIRWGGGEEPVCGHVEVDSEAAILAYAREFEEQVLALIRSSELP